MSEQKKITTAELGSKWGEMILKLLASIPDKIVAWLDGTSEKDASGHDITVKIIPFVILILSAASITNLAARAASHHKANTGPDFGPLLVGLGIAILIPVAVFIAIKIKDRKERSLVWAIAGLFAFISGTIQMQIYAPETGIVDFKSFMLWLEAITFGYGVPSAEVFLARIEALMIKQHDEELKAAAKAKEDAAIEKGNALKAEAEAEEAKRHAEAEAARKRAIEDEEDRLNAEIRRKEAELKLDALRRQIERQDEIERSTVATDLEIKKTRAASKAKKAERNGKDAVPGDVPQGVPSLFHKNDGEDKDRSETKRDKQIKMVKILTENPNATLSELGEQIGAGRTTVHRYITEMEQLEVLYKNVDPGTKQMTITVNGKADAFIAGEI